MLQHSIERTAQQWIQKRSRWCSCGTLVRISPILYRPVSFMILQTGNCTINSNSYIYLQPNFGYIFAGSLQCFQSMRSPIWFYKRNIKCHNLCILYTQDTETLASDQYPTTPCSWFSSLLAKRPGDDFRCVYIKTWSCFNRSEHSKTCSCENLFLLLADLRIL